MSDYVNELLRELTALRELCQKLKAENERLTYDLKVEMRGVVGATELMKEGIA